MKEIPEWYYTYTEQNSECKIIDTHYKDSSSKITFLCSCGNNFKRNFSKFKYLENKICPSCLKKITIEKKSFSIEYLEKYFIENSESIFISDYYDNNKRVFNIECSCGNMFKIKSRDFKKHSKKCSVCSKKDFKNNLVNGDINTIKNELKKYNLKTLEDVYLGQDYNMRFICGECNKEFISTMYKIRISKNKKCLKCTNKILKHKQKKDHDYFLKKLGEKSKEYIFHEKYKGVEELISVTHISCGNRYEIKPRNLYKDRGCPLCCSKSKGEDKIIEWLTKNNFKFKIEYRIKKCKDKMALPFDFAIFDDKNNLKMLIEYDGIQHFKLIPNFFGGLKGYLGITKRDLIKNKFCRKNKIKLIRIPYWDYDKINNILRYSLVL